MSLSGRLERAWQGDWNGPIGATDSGLARRLSINGCFIGFYTHDFEKSWVFSCQICLIIEISKKKSLILQAFLIFMGIC